jgi:PAS domain S-box-containing protein
MSIVARILGLIAGTLLLVAGVEVYNGFNLRANRELELRNEAMQLARIATLDIDRILEGARQLLATLAKLPAANGWDTRACSIVAATVNSDFEYDFITAVDSAGQILCTSSPTMQAGSTMPYPEILIQVLESRDFAVGSYGRGAVSHNELIRVGYPITDDTGEIVGVIYAGVNATWLNTAINQWQLPKNLLISISDRNGTIIARNPGQKWVGHKIVESLWPLLSAQSIGTVDDRSLEGTLHLYGYVPPDVAPSLGLMVIVGLDRTEAFAEIDRSIWLNIAVTLTVLVLAALAAWIYVRRFVDRPFQRLLSAAAHWRAGDWTARAGAHSGIPEFDRLAGAFDEMAEGVESRERQLHENAERLQRSEEHLARAQHVAAVGSFEFSFETNQREWSDETCRIFGVNSDQKPPSLASLETMVISEDREHFRKYVDATHEGRGLISQEFGIRRLDGNVRTVQFEVELVRGERGEHLKLIGICRDVTEMRELERQRKEFESQLRQAQKMESLGTLAGGIAHDLNNSLTPVIALSNLMLKQAPEGSRERETLGLIDAGGKRARDLVRRILTFARKDEPKRETLDLANAVTSTLKLMRASIPSTITIDQRITAVRPIYADEGQIVQLLTNLMTNSAQAIDGHLGTITVELSEVAESRLGDHGPAVRITVADTGCGMDEATRHRVFDPFFTTKGVGQGTGLGLSVVHGIVTSHGGLITIESQPGRGTQMHIDLPIMAVIQVKIEGEAA